MDADAAHELGFNDSYANAGYLWRKHDIPEEFIEDYGYGYTAGYNAAGHGYYNYDEE